MISYISLGSNLSEPQGQIQRALESLAQSPELQLFSVSSLYLSKALILPDTAPQNDYINAVAGLKTRLSAEQLLQQLHAIEAAQGRQRKQKWGARTLDLDILLYDEQQICSDTLVIPHAQIAQRNFVIHPLFEIAAEIDIPGLGALAELAGKTNWDGLQKLPAVIETNDYE